MGAEALAVIVLSLICLFAGTASAAASLGVPDRRVGLETVGVTLFVAGLVIVGAGLPLFR